LRLIPVFPGSCKAWQDLRVACRLIEFSIAAECGQLCGMPWTLPLASAFINELCFATEWTGMDRRDFSYCIKFRGSLS
jgi:hypothetical protein